MSLSEEPPPTAIQNIHNESQKSKARANITTTTNHTNKNIKLFKKVTARPRTKNEKDKLMFDLVT